MEGLVPQVSPAHIVSPRVPACACVFTVAAVVSSPKLARQPRLKQRHDVCYGCGVGDSFVFHWYHYILYSTQAKSCHSVALFFFFYFYYLTPVSGFTDTAPGSQRRTFWTRVCSPRSSRGKVSREAPWTCPRNTQLCTLLPSTFIMVACREPCVRGLFYRERERELYGPKKRGPKPKTFLLKVINSASIRGFFVSSTAVWSLLMYRLFIYKNHH